MANCRPALAKLSSAASNPSSEEYLIMNTATLERQAQLEYATITVQFVNEKKAGQRNASIKDVDGLYYWIRPEDMPRYQAGVTYDISYATTQSNGYTNRTIKSAE